MLGLLVIAAAVRAQPTTGPASLPTTQPVPRQTLDQIYRRELGRAYNPADFDRLLRCSELLEQFFALPESRRAVLQHLEGLGLNPNIIGRLTRIRTNWPDLAPGVYYINERAGPHAVRYFLGVPAGYNRATPWPLVIKLPTAEAFVAEPRPDPVQVTEIYTGWIHDELARHPQAIVVMPLLNLDELWGPSYAGMNSVIQPMHHVAGRCNIDPARVYLVGHAMSAHAVWNLALHYPTYFAAFNTFAGNASAEWQRVRMMNLRNTLPVIWHDVDDQVLKVDAARVLARLLRTQRIDFIYEETKNVGHVPAPATVETLYQKMTGRTRNLYPAEVSIQSNRPDTLFNRCDWVQIYQPLNTGGEKRLLFAKGSGMMTVYNGTSSISAKLAQNTINVTSQNVQSMRFYVNDQMIDFNRAVSVVVNRRPRFEALLKPSLESMLRDQLFLGRGWRYYTAFIDVEFGADSPATTAPGTQPR